MTAQCPCGGGLYSQCCQPFHRGELPSTAGQLMRSRYSAYALQHLDYLVATTLPTQQAGLDLPAIEQWSRLSQWLGLEVLSEELVAASPPHAWVSFKARWRDLSGEQQHLERSAFVQVQEQGQGRWYFIDPTVPASIGRNDACLCGSGLKFKKCCAHFCH